MAVRTQRRSLGDVAVVILAAIVIATLMAFTPILARSARAAGQPWSATTSALVKPCTADATPLICEPAHLQTIKVPRGKRIDVQRLRYTAAPGHCIDTRLLIDLNGKRIGKTDWVKATEESTVELLDLTLRRRSRGRAHRFTYKAEGRFTPGGCNVGKVDSWAGDIKLIGLKKSA